MNILIQYFIVILIGIAILIYLIYKFRCFFSKKTRKSRCDDCPGCILHPKNKR